MTPEQELILIAGMTLVTFGVRYPTLALVGRLRLPRRVVQALNYVPVAVLTAIIVPTMLYPTGELFIGLRNGHLVAGIVAIVIAWRTKNLLITILGGMAFFLLWNFVVVGTLL